MDRYQETFATWDKIAELYASLFMDLDLYNESYDRFCTAMPEGGPQILEIGCGPGNITRYLLRQRPDFSITGIDISPRMIRLARQLNPSASFQVMDARHLDQLDGTYAGIVAGFCLPYLSATDRKKLFEDCARILQEQGLLYLSFVAGQESDSGFQSGPTGDRSYFYYHPVHEVVRLLQEKGFRVQEQFTVQYTRSGGEQEEHQVLIASKCLTDS